MNQKNWTWEEYKCVRDRFPYEGFNIVSSLNSRGVAYTAEKAAMLHTSLHKEFTEEEREYARQYGRIVGTALIFFMPSRSVTEVEDLLCQEGITPRASS